MSNYTVIINFPIEVNGRIVPGGDFPFDNECDAIAFLDKATGQYFLNTGNGPTVGTIVDNSGALSDWAPEDYRSSCNSNIPQTIVSRSKKDLVKRDPQFDSSPPLEKPETLGADVAEPPEIQIIVPKNEIANDVNIPAPQSPPAGEPEKRSKDEAKDIPKVADPVNPFTGEFYLEKTDFELPSVGFPFVFVRTYKSGRTFFGPWGYNWDHNYNVYLRELNNGSIAVNSGSLQEDIYTDSGDSILYHAPRGIFSKLERQQGSAAYAFIITFKNGQQYFFRRPSGWSHAERIPLVKIQDTHENFQELVYNTKNQLEALIDTVGRRINFIYGNCDLLEAIRPEFLQEAGKPPVEIKYMHANDIEQLSAVITFPTPDFPNGLMTCYEYDEDQALPELRNNIVRVIDAKGQTVVENFYGTETTDESFNRVVKQYFMGGEYLFKYTNIRYIPPVDEYINDAYLQTEFYEPERPLKVMTFNFRGNLLDERFRLCADGSYRVWAQSYRYNANGQLTEHYYANGMADFFTYDDTNANVLAQGNLLRIDRKSQPLRTISRTINKFTYEPLYQKIKTVSDEANNITQFIYDHEINPLTQHGNLIKIKYPNATLPDGTVQRNCERSFKYDSFGQVIEELSPENRKTTFEYNLSGDGAGLVKKITAHDITSPLLKSFEYDALGNIKRIIDGSGNDTRLEHNLIGQLIKTELPSVNGSRAVYRFEYNEDRKIAREYLPKGNYTDAVLNSAFLINEYFYDVASWLVEVKKYSNTASPQVTRIQRDFFGNVKKLINPIGQEFRYKYDDRGLILEEINFSNSAAPLKTKYHYDRLGNLDKVTYPDGNFETFNYNEPFTRLKSRTNPLGVTQEYTYGMRDEISQTIIKDAAGTILQTHNFSFDEKGRMTKSDINGLASAMFYDKDNLVVKKLDHQNNVVKINYDGISRTSLVTDPLGNEQLSIYDPKGNIIANDTKSLTTQGNYISVNQQASFDARNRLVETQDPLGNKVSFMYDDRNLKTSVVNALGQRVNLYYDINGELIESRLVRNGREYTINRWHRDSIGRLISYQDAEGNVTTYSYDERGYIIQTEYPDHSTIIKEYDAVGYLKKEVDCNGTISDFKYNALGQLTEIDFQVNGGTLSTPRIRYGYDTFGRNNSLMRGTLSINKKFDAFDRVIEEQQSSMTVKKTFDDINNNFDLHFPDGRIDRYDLDKLGRVKQVIFKKQGTANGIINDFQESTVLAQFTYEGLFLKSKKYANGAVTEYSYDVEGRLSGMKLTGSSGATIDEEIYVYDGEKRKRLVLRDSLPAATKFYNYDALGRLTESFEGITTTIPPSLNDQQSIDRFLNAINTSTATHNELYTLSDNDKRTSWKNDSVHYNTAYNNLLQLNTLTASDGTNVQYTYDKNGNRLSDDKFRYFYDALDNLVKVVRKSDNTTLLEHAYDAEGRIVERRENGKSTLYFYNGMRSIHEVCQPGDVLQNTFGIGLDEYVVQSKGQSNYFYHQNNILSLNCLTDKVGNALQFFDFTSFGSPAIFDINKNLVAPSSAFVDVVFSGRPRINSVDKYDFRKRVYDSTIGLFFQRDPFGHLESNNHHQFCAHDPINRRDALGLVSDMWTPRLSGASSASADERENMRKLINDTSFGIGNAFTGGGLKKMLDRKSTGFFSDLGANGLIGVTSLSNMASLGFQDAIFNSIDETKGDLLDDHFNAYGETAPVLLEIGYGLKASVLGIGRGSMENIKNLLPIAEANILLDESSSSANKWGAVFSGISKVANILAMLAAVKNTNPITGETASMGYGLSEGGHGAVTFEKIFFDKNGPASVKVRKIPNRPNDYHIDRRLLGKDRDWNGGSFSYKDVQVPKSLFDRALKYAENRFNRNQNPETQESFNMALSNCGHFAGDVLAKAGLQIISTVPKIAQANIEKVPFLGGTSIKSAITNSAIQQAGPRSKSNT